MTFLSGKARCFASSLPSFFPGVEYFNERFIFLRLCLEAEPMKGTEFRIMASQDAKKSLALTLREETSEQRREGSELNIKRSL